MKVRWLPRAEAQLETVQDATRLQWPGNAVALTQAIQAGLAQVVAFPHSGRDGRLPHTRELVLTRFPFMLVYTVDKDDLVVLGLFHHRQTWSEDDLG